MSLTLLFLSLTQRTRSQWLPRVPQKARQRDVLAMQWLGLGAFTAGPWLPSLTRDWAPRRRVKCRERKRKEPGKLSQDHGSWVSPFPQIFLISLSVRSTFFPFYNTPDYSLLYFSSRTPHHLTYCTCIFCLLPLKCKQYKRIDFILFTILSSDLNRTWQMVETQ